VTVPLDFLARGQRWRVKSWQDGKGMNDLTTSSASLGTRKTLILKLAASGGAVAIVEPAGGE
jgi:hypothetical protein